MRNILLAMTIAVLLAACGGGGGSSSPPAPSGYTLSGTITAAGASAADSDTNDPRAPYRDNNSLAAAQSLPNPVVLGGWAAASPTGDAGDRFADSADDSDVYALYLAQGQTVRLVIGDHAAGGIDFDLFLYEQTAPGAVVASSLGSGAIEELTAPASGDYFLIVQAENGASNYRLSTGWGSLSAQTTQPLRLEDEFVPGEVLVTLRESPVKGRRRVAPGLLDALPPGLSLRGKGLGAARLAMETREQRRQALRSLNVAPARPPGLSRAMQQQAKLDTLRLVKALQARSDVAAAAPNYLRRARWVPGDPLYASQWHYPLIDLPQAWDLGRGDANVTVAVVDSGVYLAHEDLSAALLASGHDFISDPAIALDGDGLDPDPDDPGDGGSSGVSTYHGTHVAGILAARANNGLGGSGVAPETRVMPLRVLGKDGLGTSYDVMQALRYAARMSNDSGTLPPRAAEIVNLSLGGSGYSAVEQALFDELRARGILVTAAAGNNGGASVVYPAGYQGVVGVGAVDINKVRAAYSNTGAHVDLVAPGGTTGTDYNNDEQPDGVHSSVVDLDSAGNRSSGYAFYQGTSMATPHVAGVMALMKALHPALSPDDFDAALAAGLITEDLDGNGATSRSDETGFGLIDAYRAVNLANDLAGGAPLPAVLKADPASLYLPAGTASASFNLSNVGGSAAEVTAVNAPASWLTVAADSVDGSGLGEYRLSADRTGLGDAVYPATVAIDWRDTGSGSSQTLELAVSLQVGQTVPGDTGYLYVLLVDAETGSTARELRLEADAGRYPYRFEGVAAGRYYLVAGSDADHDGYICDRGEACGAWPEAGRAQVIAVSADRSGLDFASSFEATLGTAAPGGGGQGYRRLEQE